MKFAIAVLSLSAVASAANLFRRQTGNRPSNNNQGSGGSNRQGGNQQQQPTILNLIDQAIDLTIFSEYVNRTPEIRNILAGNSSQYGGRSVQNGITVFVPTNQAFQMLPQSVQALLNKNSSGIPGALNQPARKYASPESVLDAILAYHIAEGRFNVSADM